MVAIRASAQAAGRRILADKARSLFSGSSKRRPDFYRRMATVHPYALVTAVQTSRSARNDGWRSLRGLGYSRRRDIASVAQLDVLPSACRDLIAPTDSGGLQCPKWPRTLLIRPPSRWLISDRSLPALIGLLLLGLGAGSEPVLLCLLRRLGLGADRLRPRRRKRRGGGGASHTPLRSGGAGPWWFDGCGYMVPEFHRLG